MKPDTKTPIVKNSRPNKKLAVRKGKFEIPEQFLNSLDEFSSGGYVLIVANEVGDPQVYASFDGDLKAMGLAKFGKDYFNRLNQQFRESVEAHADATLD